jgi:cytochrome P450
LVDRALLQNPYPVLTGLREETAAFPMEGNGFRMWVVTRYADIRRILGGPDLRKDVVETRRQRVMQSMVRPERRARVPARSRRSLLDRDGEDHRRLRDMLQAEFRPQRLEARRPRVQDLAHRLVEALPAGEIVDLHAALSLPLAVTTVSELVGLPEAFRSRFPPLASGILTGTAVAEIEQAGEDMHDLALEIIEAKRAEPGPDLYTQLLRRHDEGALDADELASMIIVLLIGGLEPAMAISNGVMLLITHPNQQERLRAEPDRLGGCVEEVIRYESPFRMLPPRFSDRPVELEDVTIPAGEMIIFCVASGNRDPRQVDDGDRFDITRTRTAHLSFGHGPHRCLGAELGRIQTGETIAAFFRRFHSASLAVDPARIRWRPSTFLRRVDSLPVALGSAAP